MPEVEGLLAPLERLFAAVVVAEPVRRDWSTQIGANVLRAYRDIVAEVLVQAQATQKFISQRNKGAAAAAVGMDKIVAQCTLDVARLEQLYERHGIQAAGGFEALRAEFINRA